MLDHRSRHVSLAIAALLAAAAPVRGQCPFSSGSTGADGAFSPATDMTIQLPESGILNYTTISIPNTVTVRFERNARNTPVYLLASGDVTISGAIELNGEPGSSQGGRPGRGAPGGFDGGSGGINDAGAGQGPGGGTGCAGDAEHVGRYGNSRLVPLIGGSGGAGSPGGVSFGGGGGGGGGAILVASSGSLTLNGSIRANGGAHASAGTCGRSGIGSGGAIRLAANRIAGTGSLSVSGVSSGRIRFEACTNDFSGSFPSEVGVFSAGQPGPVLVGDLPTLSITAVGSVDIPANPAGSYSGPPDATFPPGTTTVPVEILAHGLALGSTVQVTVLPQTAASTTVDSSPLAGTVAMSTATANVPLTSGRSIITAQTTATISPGGGPLVVGSIAGEAVTGLRIVAAYGAAPAWMVVTASGREVALRQE